MADQENAPADLYHVIGTPRTSSTAQIKKAYFKAALTCHPDKCQDEDAKEKFQKLSRAHSILSDPEKRKLYDETGIADDGSDDLYAEGHADWDKYFRAQFPAVTLEKIAKFAKEYIGSDEERGHILDAYVQHQGEMDLIVDNIMLAQDSDRDRFQLLINEAIESGEIKAQEYTEEKNQKHIKKSNKKQNIKVKKRKEKADREAEEAEELLKEILAKRPEVVGGGGGGGLAEMIQSRNKERTSNFDKWAEGLEDRYAAMENEKKAKRKAKKAK